MILSPKPQLHRPNRARIEGGQQELELNELKLNLPQVIGDTKTVTRQASVDDLVETLQGYDEGSLGHYVEKMNFFCYLHLANVHDIRHMTPEKINNYLSVLRVPHIIRSEHLEVQRTILKNAMLAIIDKMTFRELASHLERIEWAVYMNSRDQMREALRLWVQYPESPLFRIKRHQGTLMGRHLDERILKNMRFYFEVEVRKTPEDKLRFLLAQRNQSTDGTRLQLVDRLIAFQEFVILRFFTDRMARQMLESAFWTSKLNVTTGFELRRRCILFLRHPTLQRLSNGDWKNMAEDKQQQHKTSVKNRYEWNEDDIHYLRKAVEEVTMFAQRVGEAGPVAGMAYTRSEAYIRFIDSLTLDSSLVDMHATTKPHTMDQLVPTHIKVDRSMLLKAAPVLAFDGETRLWSFDQELRYRGAKFEFWRMVRNICMQRYGLKRSLLQYQHQWTLQELAAQTLNHKEPKGERKGKSKQPAKQKSTTYQESSAQGAEEKVLFPASLLDRLFPLDPTEQGVPLFTAYQLDHMSEEDIHKTFSLYKLNEETLAELRNDLPSDAGDLHLLEHLQEKAIRSVTQQDRLKALLLRQAGWISKDPRRHSLQTMCIKMLRHPALTRHLLLPSPPYDSGEWTDVEMESLRKASTDIQHRIQHVFGTRGTQIGSVQPSEDIQGSAFTVDGKRKLWPLSVDMVYEKHQPDFVRHVCSRALMQYGLHRSPQQIKEHLSKSRLQRLSVMPMTIDHLAIFSKPALTYLSVEQLASLCRERKLITSEDMSKIPRPTLCDILLRFQLRIIRNAFSSNHINHLLKTLAWSQPIDSKKARHMLIRWLDDPDATRYLVEESGENKSRGIYLLLLQRHEYETLEAVVRRCHQSRLSLPHTDLFIDEQPTAMDLNSQAFWKSVAVVCAHDFGMKHSPSALKRLFLTWIRNDRDADKANTMIERSWSDLMAQNVPQRKTVEAASKKSLFD